MHSFRMRYVVYSLLIYIQNAFCERTCNSDFHDVESRTVLSDIIFVGEVRSMHETYSPDRIVNATMKVKSVLKGSLPKEPAEPDKEDKYKTILVGPFGPQNREKCVFDIGVGRYIVFLDGHNSSSLDPTVPFYRISAFPEPSTSNIRKIVRKYQCEKCAKAPSARIKPLDKEVQQGKKIKLRCKVSGKPPPEISWRKENKPIENRGRVRIRHAKNGKSSRLQISDAAIEDEGIYTCEVKNALGTNYKDVQVTVAEVVPPDVPHAVPCLEREKNWCLNGGTCYRVEQLNNRFCVCNRFYDGQRCKSRKINIPGTNRIKEARHLDRALTISGLVIAALVVAALILAAYVLSKKKRQNYRKKQADKRENALSTNRSENGTYHSMPMESSSNSAEKLFNNPKAMMMNSSTQTEEMMNAPFLGIAAVGRAASMSGHRGNPVSLPRQHTAPSLIQHSGTVPPTRGRLSALSATPPEFDDFRKPHVAVVNAVVESDPEQQSKRSSPSQSSKTESAHAHLDHNPKSFYGDDTDLGSKGDLSLELDQRSDYDNQPPSDMEVNLESEADVLALDASGDELRRLRGPHDLDSSDTDTQSSSSIGEEQALFQHLQSNPRIKTLQNANLSDHDSTGNLSGHLSWDEFDHQPSYAIDKPFDHQPSYARDKQFAFNPYALGNDNDIIANRYFQDHGRSSNRSSRRGRSTEEYDVELPYDPDPDATVV